MGKKILIVDDEKDILELLRYNLEREGYTILTATTGKRGLEIASQQPDLIILDVMMPEMDGFEVCRRLKKEKKTESIPVIFLTARGTELDEVVGLELGADDYVIKPISPRKIIARVRNILRRNQTDAGGEADEIIRHGAVEINVPNVTVSVGRQEIFFPKKEFEVLVYLARRPERVISRETLLDQIWGNEVQVIDRTVDVHIRKIREKLGSFASHIETVKGLGYRWTEKV